MVSGAADQDAAMTANDGQQRIPQVNESHSQNRLLRVSSISPAPMGPTTWTVTVQWSIPMLGSGSHPDRKHPLQEQPRIQWTDCDTSEPVDHDLFGNPIMNAAWQIFDPPLTTEIGQQTLTVRINEPYYDLTKAARYKKKVNRKDWSPDRLKTIGTIPAYRMRCDSIAPAGEYKIDAEWVPMQYVFTIRWGGKAPYAWRRRLLNQGTTAFYIDTDGDPTHSGDLYLGNDRVTQPVLLDKLGMPFNKKLRVTSRMLPATQAPSQPNNIQIDDSNPKATFLVFRMYDEVDFKDILL